MLTVCIYWFCLIFWSLEFAFLFRISIFGFRIFPLFNYVIATVILGKKFMGRNIISHQKERILIHGFYLFTSMLAFGITPTLP
jgi:hypothetical protein